MSHDNRKQASPILSKRSKGGRDKEALPQQADVGIICVTASELRAVKTAMKALDDFKEEVRFQYYSATVPAQTGRHRIVMTFATEQGNVSAGTATERFIDKYRPRLLVMVGMAGGIHDDAKLLDVVISTDVIYYEPRKERPNGVSSRLQTLPVTALMKRLLTTFLAEHGAPSCHLEYADGEQHSFGVHAGPVGTGEAVVGSSTSRAKEVVLGCNDKALIVETEAWGVHRAVYDNASRQDAHTHVLTIKGVADRADSEKDDSRQVRATRNAYETLMRLLQLVMPAELA